MKTTKIQGTKEFGNYIESQIKAKKKRREEYVELIKQRQIYANLTDVRFEGKGVDRYISYAEDANGKELSEDQLNDIPSDIIDEYWNA
jgi:hypothetical protein